HRARPRRRRKDCASRNRCRRQGARYICHLPFPFFHVPLLWGRKWKMENGKRKMAKVPRSQPPPQTPYTPVLHDLEQRIVFLIDPQGTERSRFLGDEFRRDARALSPGNVDAFPRAVAFPLFVKPAALTKGRGECDQPAPADGEHGADGAIE